MTAHHTLSFFFTLTPRAEKTHVKQVKFIAASQPLHLARSEKGRAGVGKAFLRAVLRGSKRFSLVGLCA